MCVVKLEAMEFTGIRAFSNTFSSNDVLMDGLLFFETSPKQWREKCFG
jgi:hypothetical protein